MTFFVESNIRARAQIEVRKSFSLQTPEKIILEFSKTFKASKEYDIFLSHSSKDAELVLGIKGIIEDLGHSVYVDWIEDTELDRANVSRKTAQKLRERMTASKTLFFVTTENASNSKWMPWECGYFDGIKEKVAIVPIKKTSYNNEYAGQEYLGLYPYITEANDTNQVRRLWVNWDKSLYTSYTNWARTLNADISWHER